MKMWNIGIGAIVALGLAVGVNAAAPQQTGTTPPKPQSAMNSAGTSIKVIGCLENNTPSAAASSSAASSASSAASAEPVQYKLTNLDKTALKSAASTVSTSGNATDLTKVDAFRVQATSGTDIATHIGEKVEVTGSLSGTTAMSGAASSRMGASAAAGTSGQPLLEVTSVRTVASSCK